MTSSHIISGNNNIASAIFKIASDVKHGKLFSRITGYTPAGAPVGYSSLFLTQASKKCMSATGNHVRIPKGAIIDRIEFIGNNEFDCGGFSIGLGAFDNAINFPLITDSTPAIANEGVGGVRDFYFVDPTGECNHSIVTEDSFLNIRTTGPMRGDLQVSVYYHSHPEFV